MIFISNKEAFNEDTSNSKQYLLRVVYDTNDRNVHRLLEGIFGPEQMLDVKNGKIAKINSTLTPKERNDFFKMISEILNKMEENENTDEKVINCQENTNEENSEDKKEINLKSENQESKEEPEEKQEFTEEKDSKKVSAEKLINEFANFLNNIR